MRVTSTRPGNCSSPNRLACASVLTHDCVDGDHFQRDRRCFETLTERVVDRPKWAVARSGRWKVVGRFPWTHRDADGSTRTGEVLG